MYCNPAMLPGARWSHHCHFVVVTFAKRHIASIRGGLPLRLPFAFGAALFVLPLPGLGFAIPAYADGGSIRFNVIKAGIVVGGSGGTGTLVFHGRRYPLAIGGVGCWFFFLASRAAFFRTTRYTPSSHYRIKVRCA